MSHSTEKMLKKINYYDYKTMVDHVTHLSLWGKILVLECQHKYSQVIGSLLYVSNRARPHIAFVVCRLSRYTSYYNNEHWTGLERVFRYLRETLDYNLLYIGYPDVIEGYSVANWVWFTDSNDVKSTTRYVFSFGGAAVSWFL